MNKFLKFFSPNTNLSPVLKITIAALLTALVTVLQKVLAINYIAVIPFLRISFGGCALTIFASILLGPIYGLFVGAGSDLLGYFIFDPKTMSLFPQITAIYALLGFGSFFVYKFVKLIKSRKVMMCVEYGSFAALFLAVTLFVTLSPSIKLYSSTYELETWQKIVTPIILFVLLSLLAVMNYFSEKFFIKRGVGDKVNIHQISFACFIIEILIMIIFGTLMKGFAFGFATYPAILISQIIVAFINIPLNTFLISYIMLLTRKYFE